MDNIETVKIKPYARLLTMLGDQLIKDEIIAITELVKNSYDADAEHVCVRFENFDKNATITPSSRIIIEDDGNGMNKNILKDAWMNPATPEKLKKKKVQQTTDKGRIMQGEKGIGRFAIFKLGKRIQITTRRQKQIDGHFVNEPESDEEYVLTYDFSSYDSDFLYHNNQESKVFLDDLEVKLETRTAREIIEKKVEYGKILETRKPYGTKIVIDNLIGLWTDDKTDMLNDNLLRMQPIFQTQFKKDFVIDFSINRKVYISKKKNANELLTILNEKSVFIVEGEYIENRKEIAFTIDDHEKKIPYVFGVDSSEIKGIKPMKDYLDELETRDTECGSFHYRFYIMDLDVGIRDKSTRYYLDKSEIASIKNHRVYLYRDNVRVLPYGDTDDDWLKLDMIRGTEKAGRILGNDQVVGYISITQKGNPKLKDKTNREGLIEEGYAKEDLIKICELILRYIRTGPYARYLIDKKKKRDEPNKPMSIIQKERKTQTGKEFVEVFLKQYGNNPVSELNNNGGVFATKFFNDFEAAYNKDRSILEDRITRTEDLAAIGLSAETAYHDSRLLLSQIKGKMQSLIQAYDKSSGDIILKAVVVEDLKEINSLISRVADLMHNLQKLFPSTKNKRTNVNVNSIIEKVKFLYSPSMEKAGISCIINEESPIPLIVNCTDAVILQVFINLFDNSLYWLKTVGMDRRIAININSKRRQVLFSDSGPGVRNDDAPYIFEPFYTKKGEDGKGLGLYIARQLLDRYNATIDLVNRDDIMHGASFSIVFAVQEESINGN